MAVVEYVKGATDANAGASYSTGAKPVSGDELNFSAGSGVFNVNTSTALVAVDLLKLSVREGCSVQIGDESNPLAVDINQTSTGIFEYYGGGTAVYLKGGNGGVIYEIKWAPANGAARLNLLTCANTILRAYSGIVVVPGDVTLAGIDILGPATVVAQEHASDTIGTVNIANGGRLIARRRLAGTCTIGEGGAMEYDVDTTNTTGQSVVLMGGEVMLRKGSLVVTGRKGTLDYSRLEKTGYTLTIEDHPGLTERQGGILPTFSRTTPTKPSRKITA
jgi:hypothetical protein